MANPPFGTTPQRAEPKKVTGTIDEIWEAFHKAFTWIFQLASSHNNVKETTTKNTASISNATTVIMDTHANRKLYPPENYALGSRYVEIDRGLFVPNLAVGGYVEYIVQLVGLAPAWVYLSGVMVGALAALPNDLGPNDNRFLFYATDFFHAYRWSANVAVWRLAPGDPGSGYMVMTSGAAPHGGKWHICDGSTQAVAQDNGTTANEVLPNLVNPGANLGTFIGGSAAVNVGFVAGAAGGGTATIGGNTGSEATHTHALSANTGVDSGAGTVVAAGVGTTVATHTHTHPQTSPTAAGSSHNHTLPATATVASNAPTDAGGGLPDHYYGTWYYRL